MVKKIRGASILVLALAASACATANPEKALERIETPASWTSIKDISAQASEGALPLNWVSTFNDPELEKLILEAMRYNTDLGAARQRVMIAKQNAATSLGGLLPALQGTLRGNQDDSASAFSTDPTTQNSAGSRDSYSLNVSASWEADIWLSNTDGTRASYKDAAAARANYQSTRLSIAGTVAQSYYGLVASRLQRELAERDVERGQANLRITERRYERGVSSSLDVRLARSSLAASQASLISRQQAELESTRALEILLGRYPEAELKTRDSLPSLQALAAADGSVIGLGTPDALLDKRPDILAAEASLMAEGLRNRQARKNFLPALQITGSAITGSSFFDTLLDGNAIRANVAATLTQTLFSGGRLTAARKRQKAVLEQAVYSYVGTVLKAYGEVENAITAETLLAAREEALRLAFEESKASEELTERQYISGTRNIFDLLQAQSRRISNESQYIAAAQQRLNNRVALYLALGGTFSVGDESVPKADKNWLDKNNIPLFKRWWAQSETSQQE